MARIFRQEQGLKILLILASLVVLIAGLKAAQGFFVPVLLAFFIATVSFPITFWLRTHKVPRLLAVLTTVLVDFLFLAGIVVAAVALLGDLQTKWTFEYQPRAIEFIKDVEHEAVAKLREWKVEEPEKKVREYVTGDLLTQLSEIKVQDLLNIGTDVVGRVASFLGTAFIVLILTVFMLTEARMYGRRLNAIAEARGPNLQRMLSATRDIQRYLGIKTAVSLATGVLAGFLCGVARLDFFLLWGIVAFTLNYIPVVGSIIAGIAPTIMALLLYGWPHAAAVLIGYVAINVFLGNFVEPMLMGSRFGMSTLVVMMSVLFWGWVWGPVGMLLAVPIMMMLKVVLDNSFEFRWLSVAIGKEPSRGEEDEKRLKEAVEEAVEEVDLPESAAPEGSASQ